MVGRIEETKLLEMAYKDDKSHFIAIYGRRRIGKTFLVRETFHGSFTFSHTGVSEGDLGVQLQSFEGSLRDVI